MIVPFLLVFKEFRENKILFHCYIFGYSVKQFWTYGFYKLRVWHILYYMCSKNNAASEILSTREKHMADRFTQSVMDKMRSLWISSYLKRNRMWKKLFFWLQGPGDIKTKTVSLLYRNKKTVFGSA